MAVHYLVAQFRKDFLLLSLGALFLVRGFAVVLKQPHETARVDAHREPLFIEFFLEFALRLNDLRVELVLVEARHDVFCHLLPEVASVLVFEADGRTLVDWRALKQSLEVLLLLTSELLDMSRCLE